MKMRIWCVPSATELESPKLPPRIDRDVYLRSPPPPPRLSKEQKLARGVIVLKNRKSTSKGIDKHRKIRKASTSSSSKSTLDSSSPPPPPPPRKNSPTRFGSLPNSNGSVIGTHKYSSSYSRKSRSTSDFKAHINNGGSVTSNSLILHPGTSKTRQKKIKRRKRGKCFGVGWFYFNICTLLRKEWSKNKWLQKQMWSFLYVKQLIFVSWDNCLHFSKSITVIAICCSSGTSKVEHYFVLIITSKYV